VNQRPLVTGLALSTTIALAALHGLFPVIPKLAIAAPAWLAGALVWARAGRRTRVQALALALLGLAAMAAAVARGGRIDAELALAGNAMLVAMLGAVTFLRLVTHAAREDERPPPRGRPAVWSTLLGVHLFGAVINLSVVFLMADRLADDRRLQPRQVSVLTRGFSAAAFWSPFFAAMAAAITYAPGASLAVLIAAGLPLAACAILLTGLTTDRASAARFIGYPMRYGTLWLPALLAVLVLALHQASPSWPVLSIICLLTPGIALIVSLLRAHGSPTPVVRHVRSGLPAMANELVLFLAAGLLASGAAALFASFEGWLPFAEFRAPQAALTLLAMWLVALVGVHPVIGIAVLGSLLAPLRPDPNLLAMTFLAAWATGVAASPFSGMNLALQGRYDIPPWGFLRWNGVYGLLMMAAASLTFLVYDRYFSG
jgi:hypothetical protein